MLIRKDGSEISIDDSGAPIRNEAGELTGIVMVFRDITMERRTRAALLANEKLAVAGRLAATIAHEIHNPLDSVANLLYLLQHDPKEDEAKHFLEIAQTELARVTQISRAMLSLYRESKAPVPVNLRDMLDDLLLLMEGRFNTLGVHVSTDLPPGITVDGFPAELRQVFTNLITNAAEAAGQGGAVARPHHPPGRGSLPVSAACPREPSSKSPTTALESPPISGNASSSPSLLPRANAEPASAFGSRRASSANTAAPFTSTAAAEGSDHGAIATVFLASKPILNPGGD